MSFAEVIIEHKSSSVDKRFTYQIPEELVNTIKPGVRVVVPFGRFNKPVMGIIVDIKNKSNITQKIKNITQLLDDKPLISKNRLNLAKWIKDEYLCTEFEAMQPILPPGDFRDIKTFIEFGENYKSYISKSPDEKTILSNLSHVDKIEYSQLQKDCNIKEFNKTIERLEELSVLKVILDIKTKNTYRTEKIIKKSVNFSYSEGEKIVGKSAKKQLEIWEFLKDKKEVSVKEVLQKFKTSLSVIKAMEKKLVLTIEEKAINERPVSDLIQSYKKIKLNSAQRSILEGILLSDNKFSLIHGITGSGKTEVYLQLVEKMLKKNKDSIVLVPEISLTPQTIDRFVGRFGENVAILHSKLSQLERFDQWRRIKSGEYKIVVGARSALFAPFKNLGLVIIDEEHENTYKSSNNPKYNTIDVAKELCKMEDAKLVLGTATPSLETYYRTETGEFDLYELDSRATKNTIPAMKIVDMRDELQQGNRSIFSQLLFKEMNKTIEEKNQLILFLNRRGYAGFITCRSCGYVSKCDNCDISLTLHKSTNRLRCHYCGDTRPMPKKCPSCGSKYFKNFGIGTEKIEEEVRKLFPEARVKRMDSDSIKTRNDYENALDSMKNKEIDILIGTQMISKGLDFPGVTLVGIIAADTTLNLPDFRSPERTYQLVTQVAGRAGRGDLPGNVVLQTYSPEHYSITTAVTNNYKEFYSFESELRREFGYPPYKSIATITILGKDPMEVKRSIEYSSDLLKKHIKKEELSSVEIMGPHPAPLERINNNFRWQILLKFGYNDTKSMKNLIRRVYIKDRGKIKFDDIKISIDINPSSIL